MNHKLKHAKAMVKAWQEVVYKLENDIPLKKMKPSFYEWEEK